MIDNTEKLKKTAYKLIIALCTLIFGALAIFAIPKVLFLLMPFLIGYLISLIVRPLVKLLHKILRFPNKLAAAVSLIITIFAIATGLYFLGRFFFFQVRDLYNQWPVFYEYIKLEYGDLIDKWLKIYGELPIETKDFITSVMKTLANQLTGLINPATRIATDFALALPGALIFTIVAIMSTYFMSADQRMMQNIFKSLASKKFYHRMVDVKDQLKKAVGGYCKAQLMIMCVVFVIIATGLTIAGVKYSFVIAFAIAIVDAVPMLGSGAFLLPWGGISMIAGDMTLGISLVIIYAIVLLTRQLIEPKIVGNQIGLHPLVTLLSMYIGLKLFGFLGLIFGPILILIIINFAKADVFGLNLHRGKTVEREEEKNE